MVLNTHTVLLYGGIVMNKIKLVNKEFKKLCCEWEKDNKPLIEFYKLYEEINPYIVDSGVLL